MVYEKCPMCNKKTSKILEFGFGKFLSIEDNKEKYIGPVENLAICVDCWGYYQNGSVQMSDLFTKYQRVGGLLTALIGLAIMWFGLHIPKWEMISGPKEVALEALLGNMLQVGLFIMVFIVVAGICFIPGAIISILFIPQEWKDIAKRCDKWNYVKLLPAYVMYKKKGYSKIFWPDKNGKATI